MPYDKITRATDVAPHIDSLPSRQRSMFPEIQDPMFWDLYERCREYSIVHVPGFYNVFQSINYIARNGVPGNFVECGRFLGGIAMFMGLLRASLGLEHKQIVLFDTFVGAPVGSADIVMGAPFVEREALPSYRDVVSNAIAAEVGSLDGYHIVEGMVEETLPATITGDLALLRLDTDYYNSTRIELEVLYPRLVRGGVLVVDDYGMFEGARRATDEYFADRRPSPMLNRIDVAIWAGVKP